MSVLETKFLRRTNTMEVGSRASVSGRSIWLTFAALLFSFALCDMAHAQSTAALNGTVTDPAGAAVPNAQVLAKDQATGVESSTQTDSAGAYLFPSLPIGIYRVEVTGSGFQTAVITDF